MTTARFDRAYNALVTAYFTGNLIKCNCRACAVGNIVKDALKNRKISLRGCLGNMDYREEFWAQLFCTQDGVQYKRETIEEDMNEARFNKIATKLFELTDYTEDELAQVEFVFETNTTLTGTHNTWSYFSEIEYLEDHYKGLAAVVDVLLKLDRIEDDGHKAKFRQHPKLQTV